MKFFTIFKLSMKRKCLPLSINRLTYAYILFYKLLVSSPIFTNCEEKRDFFVVSKKFGLYSLFRALRPIEEFVAVACVDQFHKGDLVVHSVLSCKHHQWYIIVALTLLVRHQLICKICVLTKDCLNLCPCPIITGLLDSHLSTWHTEVWQWLVMTVRYYVVNVRTPFTIYIMICVQLTMRKMVIRVKDIVHDTNGSALCLPLWPLFNTLMFVV